GIGAGHGEGALHVGEQVEQLRREGRAGVDLTLLGALQQEGVMLLPPGGWCVLAHDAEATRGTGRAPRLSAGRASARRGDAEPGVAVVPPAPAELRRVLPLLPVAAGAVADPQRGGAGVEPAAR